MNLREINDKALREQVQATANKFSAQARKLLEEFDDARARQAEQAPKAKGASRTAQTRLGQ